MTSPIRLVLIDDNPDDRSLAARELRREIPGVHIDEVLDKLAFESVLTQECPALVITDYQLCWTTGLEIAKALKSRWPDCPVVMFTGTGSEEIAVQAMKSGIEDYVLKSPAHFPRLATAARTAITLSQQRKQLSEAEHRYTNLFNTVPIGLYSATPTGQFLDANPALLGMLGFVDRSELLGTPIPALFANPAEYHRWHKLMERTGEVPHFEAQLKSRSGPLRWMDNNARAIRDARTRQIVYEGSLQDITDRKVAEQEREDLIHELQIALGKVKTLHGLLPICASCKKIRDDHGYWNQIEVYIQEHSDAAFTHSFCPDCALRLYPEVFAHDEK